MRRGWPPSDDGVRRANDRGDWRGFWRCGPARGRANWQAHQVCECSRSATRLRPASDQLRRVGGDPKGGHATQGLCHDREALRCVEVGSVGSVRSARETCRQCNNDALVGGLMGGAKEAHHLTEEELVKLKSFLETL